MNWQNIQTVFLDMDGTLLDLHFDNHFWLEHMPIQYAEKHGISADQARTTLAKITQEKEGTLDWYCLDYWQRTLDMDIVGLKHQVADKIAVRANVESLLHHIKEQGCRLVLLTNAHHKAVSLKFEYTPIESYFDKIITSHEIGIAKEENGFWDKLLETEDFDPQRSLFIDDNLDVLAAAENHGIANLLAIHQPDSQQPPKDTLHYTAVECFSQLMA
jgi:putative hydrolase of the HAD superfamily